mgnify:CR=1 FL=1
MSTEQNTMATMVRAFAEIIERMVKRFDEQGADHEREMAEHRASFGARTEADRKIIEGLRTAADEQVLSASKVAYVLRCAGETPVQAAQRVVKERDGLLTQVQDQRAEIERLRGDRFARHWHDVVRLDEAGFAEAAFADRELANAVARHKSMFFAEKAADRTPIDYAAAVNGGLQLVPVGDGAKALEDDYARMVEDGLLFDDAEPFEALMARCADIAARANSAAK